VLIAADGAHVWLASGASVTELDAATGALVRGLQGQQYGFNQAWAIASDGTHVWVANDSETNDGSVTELNAATGALVKVLSKSKDEFGFPDAIASDGTHVWVANGVGDSLTEFSA
jgi:DNA-binding beta-propeller fold protein YncE